MLEMSKVHVTRLVKTRTESLPHTSTYLIVVIQQLDYSDSILFAHSISHPQAGDTEKEGVSQTLV